MIPVMSDIRTHFAPMRLPGLRSTHQSADEIRRSAVRLSYRIRSVDVAYLFNVSPITLCNWRQWAREGRL